MVKPSLRSRVRRRVLQYTRALAHRLGRLACPVCERRVAWFEQLPKYYYENMDRYGFDYRTRKGETCNADAYSCPHCGASDRDRLYALFLGEALPREAAGFSLLDIAPSAPLSAYIRRTFKGEYRTADLLMEDVNDREDITCMTYPEARFNALICSHVLEHVPDDCAAMSELYRVLKPGGWGIIMVPVELGLENTIEDENITSEADRWRVFGQNDHVRMYSKTGFIERLQAAGFTVELHKGAIRWSDRSLRRVGIAPESVLYIGRKL